MSLFLRVRWCGGELREIRSGTESGQDLRRGPPGSRSGVENHAIFPVGFHELSEPIIRPDKQEKALIFHPVQQLGIPAGIGDHPVKPIK